MFNSFKEKLKNWTKKLGKEEYEREVGKIKEKSPKPTREEKQAKREEKKIEKTARREAKKETKGEIKEDSKKELKVPLKFNKALQGYEPDIEKLAQVQEELSKEKEVGENLWFGQKKIKISEKEFEVFKDELETLLLENNVAFDVTEEIITELKKKIFGQEFLKKEVEEQIKDILSEIIKDILIEPFDIIEKIKEKKESNPEEPYIILFCGINGSGKTTSIAKIAEKLKEQNLSSVIAAADTFRAASIEQIKTHGQQLNIPVIAHDYGTDPASVGFDAITYARKNQKDCVLIDTAGRMHTDKNLLREIEKVVRVCKPDTKIFVGESLTGNDAIEQAKTFNWHIGIDGIILTKADIDEKGGTALSVGYVTKKPILFLGTGQEYDKIEPFDKKRFIERLGL